MPWSGLSAQFSHPNTTDIVVGSCKSYGVEHTGTSLLGDWQVTVVDGDKPSIIFYNHATGQEDCHLLEAANHGFTVIDPDVVWDTVQARSLDINISKSGIYFAHIIDLNGKRNIKKLVINP